MSADCDDSVGRDTRTSPKVLGEVKKLLEELASPRPGGDRTKAAIDRAAKRSGLSYWRTFDLWYVKAKRVEQFEIDAIADAVEEKRKAEERNEIHAIKMRIAVLEARLANADEAFHRPTIDWAGEEIGRLGGTAPARKRA